MFGRKFNKYDKFSPSWRFGVAAEMHNIQLRVKNKNKDNLPPKG